MHLCHGGENEMILSAQLHTQSYTSINQKKTKEKREKKHNKPNTTKSVERV